MSIVSRRLLYGFPRIRFQAIFPVCIPYFNIAVFSARKHYDGITELKVPQTWIMLFATFTFAGDGTAYGFQQELKPEWPLSRVNLLVTNLYSGLLY